MNSKKLANILFSTELKSVEYYQNLYKPRQLKDASIVTRFAPSPTGFLHFGGLFTSFVANRVAKQSDGKYILRIEDTDKKREVEGGVDHIVQGLKDFDIKFDEKVGQGDYGPYRQSERKEIYMSFAKHLVEQGKAYPCFCSTDQLLKDRQNQEKQKTLLGYYGHYARCRNLSYEEIEQKINEGEKYAIRLKVDSTPDKKVTVKDAIRGELKLSDNYIDVVILKSDFLPPYNFAHVVDDTLMRVNLVVRGDEYIPSIAEHLQIFKALELRPIKYAHVAPIQKMDGESKRKISKRKDPEAAVSFYYKAGYPSLSVMEYILTIANSNFEDWRMANKNAPITDFKVDLKKMGVSGALFDFAKLNDVSKNVISKFTAQKVYEDCLKWSKKYDKELANLLEEYKEFSISMLNIEREQKRPRQDIEKWADVKPLHSYFYDKLLNPTKKQHYEFDYENFNYEDIKAIMGAYLNSYNKEDDKQTWFSKIKQIAPLVGYADDMKAYKANPSEYKGHYGNVSTIIRIILTGRTKTPDLYEICKLLGKESMRKRVVTALEILG